MERYFGELATAFVRSLESSTATIEDGSNAGLRLHKFKQNAELPRVKRVSGILRGLAPDSLLDIGSGRGTFLWPLLASFPSIQVTAIDWNEAGGPLLTVGRTVPRSVAFTGFRSLKRRAPRR